MRKLLVGLFLLTAPGFAFAGMCDGDYRCGGETYDNPQRAPKPIAQPQATQSVMGSCGENLPMAQAYQAQPTGVSCGGASVQKERTALPVAKEVMDQWDVVSRSGRADAQQEMQRLRTQEQKWTGQLSIPMTESWTYQRMVGGYADHCGSENFQTTCYRSREEEYTKRWTETVCDKYEEDPPPSSNYNSGGGYNGGGSSRERDSYSSPYSSGSPKDSGRGRGEDRKDFKKDSQDSWGSSLAPDYLPGGTFNFIGTAQAQERSPSGRRCVRSHEENRSARAWRSTTPASYSCVKSRPKWCTWLQTTEASRACKTHVAKYVINYEKDPKWVPGFVDQKDPARRSYIEILPNRWDLLQGEKEIVQMDLSGGSTVSPSLGVANAMKDHPQPWNEYSFQSQPQSVRCAYNMAPEFKVGVITHGRILQAAPNPLHVPAEPLKFDLSASNRPQALELNDGGRGTRLKAAQNARNLGRNSGTDELYKNKGEDQKGASASGGYYEETRFKIQLFRKDNWGREVRVTVKPESYSYDQIDVFDNTITISLEGQDATARFYRPGGPMEFLFGRLYKGLNVELTPGQAYYIRIRLVTRGLPFYESGCTGGKAICQGEEGSNEAYSEAIDIPFIADPNVDTRSFLKKFRDWQERRKWF